jgi:hypothetical protein
VSRLTQDLNTHVFTEIGELTEQSELQYMSGIDPVLATPAIAGFAAVVGAAGAGFAIEELVGDG